MADAGPAELNREVGQGGGDEQRHRDDDAEDRVAPSRRG